MCPPLDVSHLVRLPGTINQMSGAHDRFLDMDGATDFEELAHRALRSTPSGSSVRPSFACIRVGQHLPLLGFEPVSAQHCKSQRCPRASAFAESFGPRF